jgi:phage-related protein
MEIAQDLPPVLADVIGIVFDAISPLLPMLGPLIRTLLEPLSGILKMLVTNLMPPLVSIIEALMLIIDVLMPPLTKIITALLPPLCQVLRLAALYKAPHSHQDKEKQGTSRVLLLRKIRRV